MLRRNRLSHGLQPRMGNLRRVNAVTSNWERTLGWLQSGLINRSSVEDNLQCDSFAGTPHSLQTMSSSSLDTEMSFDPEDSKIYYIAEVESEEKLCLVTLIEVANFKQWQPNWFICWRPSSQRRMDSQIPEGGCWQRTRTNSEWQTRRQYSSQWMVRL